MIEDDVIYLSPMSGPRRAWRHPGVGWIVTPANDMGVPDDVVWAADCGLEVAKSADPADLETYLDWLELSRYDRSHCLFAVAPDVLGDARATWERSAPLLPLLRGLSYPAALVAQDGFDPEMIDWSAFDVLFIGGDPARRPEWKRSERGGYAAIAEAKRRGKWVHVGRVNGGPFLRNVAGAGADSADGSIVCHGPDKYWPRVTSWLDRLSSQPPMELLTPAAQAPRVAALAAPGQTP